MAKAGPNQPGNLDPVGRRCYGCGMSQPAHHTLISSMKDEGPFILEWVAHHRVLGFDRICVASNDCRDGTDRLLAALAAAGYVEHVANVVAAGQIPQHAGYEAMRAQLRIDDTEWLMMLDADEFLNVHVGGHRVGDLTAVAGDADIVALHAMCFTGGPEVNWQPGPICPISPWRLALDHKANKARKSLTRNPARFKGIHNHSLVGFKGMTDKLQVMGGDGVQYNLTKGVPIWQQLRQGPLDGQPHLLAQYNHYAVKTWDTFNLRRERGRGAVAVTDESTARHTEAYFMDRNMAEAQDLSIGRYAAEVAALMGEMVQDVGVRRCQAECDAVYGELAARYRI